MLPTFRPSSIPEWPLKYDPTKWEEVPPKYVNTLQVFITTRCNLRCPECFVLDELGNREMSLAQYKAIVLKYADQIEKILLSGGEPTLHRNIREIIEFNHSLGKRTTIYSNGARLDRLRGIPLEGLSVRVSVFGLDSGVKALRDLEPYDHLPVMFTYMLKPDNVDQLLEIAYIMEYEYHSTDLLISSVLGRDYWTVYDYTLPLDEYARVVNEFVAQYDGYMTLHIATRGVLRGKYTDTIPNTCRFGNVLMDKLIQCPYDIERDLRTDEIRFGEITCNKNDKCLLAKITLKRRI